MFAFGRNVDRKGFLGPLHFRLFHPFSPSRDEAKKELGGERKWLIIPLAAPKGKEGEGQGDGCRAFLRRSTDCRHLPGQTGEVFTNRFLISENKVQPQSQECILFIE